MKFLFSVQQHDFFYIVSQNAIHKIVKFTKNNEKVFNIEYNLSCTKVL